MKQYEVLIDDVKLFYLSYEILKWFLRSTFYFLQDYSRWDKIKSDWNKGFIWQINYWLESLFLLKCPVISIFYWNNQFIENKIISLLRIILSTLWILSHMRIFYFKVFHTDKYWMYWSHKMYPFHTHIYPVLIITVTFQATLTTYTILEGHLTAPLCTLSTVPITAASSLPIMAFWDSLAQMHPFMPSQEVFLPHGWVTSTELDFQSLYTAWWAGGPAISLEGTKLVREGELFSPWCW